jgi:hypothetical protein
MEEETMTPPEPPASVKDWGLSWIRTGVPILWGYLLTLLATRFPEVHALLDNPQVLAAVVGAVTLVWYGLMRKIEHRLPPWLTRFVLGANTAPQYVEGQVVHGTLEEFERPPS